MTRLHRLKILTILLVTLSACNSVVNKTPAGGGMDSSTAVISSFSSIQTVIFAPKCLSCHGAASSEGGVDLSNYRAIMSNAGLAVAGHPETSRIYTEVASGSMPDGGPALSPNEISAIGAWIDAGAPDGDFANASPLPTPLPSPNPTPAAGVPLYADVQSNIFDKSCVRCHSGSKSSGNVNLSSYEKLVANARPKVLVAGNALKSKVYTEIENGSMPPKGAGIDSRLILLLKDWINNGAKKN